MYLTYDKYNNQGGKLTEAAFCRLERKARRRVDYLTFGRIIGTESVPEAISLLVLDLIPLFSVLEEFETGQRATSYSNDGVSVNYTASTVTEITQKIDSMIVDVCSRLETADGTPLLYRGCDT